MKKKFTLLTLLLIYGISCRLLAQTEETKSFLSQISLTGYVDAYAAIYTDGKFDNAFQKFPTVSPKNKQFGLNIAQLSVKYSGEKIRSTITLHYGDIPLSAWSSDFNMIQEANVGFRLCNKLWADVGFFRTHIGAEGLYPKENIASSISIPTYFEPYYEAGIKLNYQPTDKLMVNVYLLNGYNTFIDTNEKKSLGILATYTFNDFFNIGYSNYIGDDAPDDLSESHIRFYNNIFFNYEKNKFKLTAGFDFATQQHSDIDDADKSASMYSALLALRYSILKKINLYTRGEIFQDESGFLSGIDYGALSGLKIAGLTFGIEYKPTENAYIRLEGRNLTAADGLDIFMKDEKPGTSRLEALFNVGIWF